MSETSWKESMEAGQHPTRMPKLPSSECFLEEVKGLASFIDAKEKDLR
jgi:hypothetical protein